MIDISKNSIFENEKLESIEGLLTKNEQKLLYSLARKCDGNIVEIGSWKGLSTICLALGLDKKYRVYAIDPHRGNLEHVREGIKTSYHDFLKNIKKFKLENRVVPMVMTSEEAFKKWNKGKISMLWVDGNHEYDYVKYDLTNWGKIVKKNGIIAIHDFAFSPQEHPGVRKVVFNYMLNWMRFENKTDYIIVFSNNGKTNLFRISFLKIQYFFHSFIIKHRDSFFMKIAKKIFKSMKN